MNEIIINIINYPNAPRFYRQLRDYLKNKNRENEYEAIIYLLKEKFKEE